MTSGSFIGLQQGCDLCPASPGALLNLEGSFYYENYALSGEWWFFVRVAIDCFWCAVPFLRQDEEHHSFIYKTYPRPCTGQMPVHLAGMCEAVAVERG